MKHKLPLLFILVIHFFSILLAQEKKTDRLLTIKNIYRDNLFYPEYSGPFKSMKDGRNYTILRNSADIVSYDYETGKSESTIFSARGTGLSSIYDYEFSDDEKYILLATSRVEIYRHSYHADYYIYDTENKVVKALSKNGKQQYARFSPDGKHIAFVRDNNLFITYLPSMREIQVTSDGKRNFIINGAPDWVYEEEFALTNAFMWSPDSRRIAYYRFDESGVREYPMIRYNDIYPELVTFKYPKAGEKNAVVSIHVYELSDGRSRRIDTGEETDQYIGRIFWTRDPEVLSIIRINRLQNRMDILHASVPTGKTETVYTETNKRYIREPEDDMIYYLNDKRNFIIKSEKDGWLHLYLYDFIKKSIKPVTQGEFDISEFLGYDEKTKRVFYLSHERSPLYQDVYSTGLNGKDRIRLSEEEGWYTAEFSNGFNYFIRHYSTANQPELTSIHMVAGGRLIRVVEDNRIVTGRMKEFGFSRIEFMKVPVSAELELNAYMIKPPDYDPGKKYPLLLFVYGGPESQKVMDAFSISNVWFQVLVQNGYIVACVDGRGTGSRGEEFRKSTWLQLGKYETLDQIAAAKYLGSLDFIDKSRIGIYGWSYGGFMSLLCLEKGADIFKMAISVAPVTDWKFYDTIYTERFMRTPSENEEGYTENSPLNHAGKIKGKLLVVHGMFDDNVHLQNSAELVRKMILNNIRFDMLFYPDRNHNIREENATIHVHEAITDYIFKNL